MDEKAAYELQQELAELQVAVARKRNEVSNLSVGYRRAIEGIGPIPADPLLRNLISARAELTQLQQRLAQLERELGTSPEVPFRG